ncbi:hypothetical protein GRI34_08830 [Erythrobacter aquimaris]|uniref:Uncharacterized protein n=1 Tax=Qipengyuania aquimaris TaxID=255984 RepID=A0A6I4TL03_9SPHN|nr:hypothetical protein [Qipengyuania aquimaris]MXO96516.1 hypothetical protein [Qipengyuania aquimaris]
MNKQATSAMLALFVGAGLSTPAAAQVAAEEAMILSGASGQGSAQRALSDSITGSVNSAAQALRAANSASSAGTGPSSGSNSAGYAGSIPEGDPLENTDAKAYQVQGGARIKVSGSFRPSQSTSCEQNCDPEAAETQTTPDAAAEQPE